MLLFVSHLLLSAYLLVWSGLVCPSEQGVLFVRNCEVSKCEHAGKAFSLSLLLDGKKTPVYADCGKGDNQADWVRALII